ncbi:MAG: hypothetical protein JW889_14215 [Verrucomicrobia bacterium]|nr:hypothetical protein [Verrucomicrobiota bacterium]
MCRVLAILLLVLSTALAVAQDKAEADDIAKYDPFKPPEITPRDVYPEEIDQKTFILVEGALLVPDAVTIIREVRVPPQPERFEVVDTSEFDRYQPVIELRLGGFLNLSAAAEEDIVRFEQRMWRDGLRLALRTYAESRESQVRYQAFRVEFYTTGRFYRAVLTLYREKAPSEQTAGRLHELSQAIAEVRQAVDGTRQSIGASIDRVEGSVTRMSGELGQLKNEVSSVEQKANSVEQKTSSIESTVSSLSSSVSSLSSRVSSLESK